MYRNPITDPEYRGRIFAILAFFVSTAGLTQAAGPEIAFAEDLFPELRTLMTQAAVSAPEIQLGALRFEEGAGYVDLERTRDNLRISSMARLTGSYEMREDIDDEFGENYYINVTASKPVYQWGNIKRRQEIAETKMDVRRLDLERTATGQFMALRTAYLKWLLMTERRTVLQRSIELTESFVEAQRELVEAGQVSEQELLEIETRLLESRESLAWVENNRNYHMRRMEVLTGSAPDGLKLDGATLSAIEPMSLDTLSEMTQRIDPLSGDAYLPAVERLKLLEEVETQELAVLDKENWPVFDIIAGVDSDQLDSINQSESIHRVRYFTGVRVRWNIFDGWQTKARKRSALARKQMHALSRDQLMERLDRESDSLVSEIEYLIKQTEARKMRRSLMERRLKLVVEQSERNLAPASRRVQAEVDLLDISQRVMESRVNYLIALMNLGNRMGMDPFTETLALDR